jgi:hypothetical protein
MRVNTRVFTERTDMMGEFQIPNCPSQFKVVAERLLNLITKPGYAVGDYRTTSQLDKMLMVDYWREYDMLDRFDYTSPDTFKMWFVTSATSPELLRRSRQWLQEHQYIFLKAEVAEHAQEAGDKFRMSIRK